MFPAISSTGRGVLENTFTQTSFTSHNGFVIASAVDTTVFCNSFPGILVGFIPATLFLASGSARFVIVPIWFAVSSVQPALFTA